MRDKKLGREPRPVGHPPTVNGESVQKLKKTFKPRDVRQNSAGNATFREKLLGVIKEQRVSEGKTDVGVQLPCPQTVRKIAKLVFAKKVKKPQVQCERRLKVTA